MNFLAELLKILPIVPAVASGIEGIVGGASLSTKVQLATQSLTLATATAAALLPGPEAAIAQAAGQSALAILEATVTAIHNANNPAPAPVAE
jgi:hypothetical protein